MLSDTTHARNNTTPPTQKQNKNKTKKNKKKKRRTPRVTNRQATRDHRPGPNTPSAGTKPTCSENLYCDPYPQIPTSLNLSQTPDKPPGRKQSWTPPTLEHKMSAFPPNQPSSPEYLLSLILNLAMSTPAPQTVAPNSENRRSKRKRPAGSKTPHCSHRTKLTRLQDWLAHSQWMTSSKTALTLNKLDKS